MYFVGQVFTYLGVMAGRHMIYKDGGEGPLEESMASHFSILVWRIPWTEEPGRLQTIGLQSDN